ncbi:MAG: hypothetical protein AAFX87_19795 [Bacteroidota bacterium]
MKFNQVSFFVIVTSICFCLLPTGLMAQEEEGYDPAADLSVISTPLTINLDEEEEAVEIKKKKRKRNVFYGLKTKKGFTRKGFGENTTYELFRFLKTPQEPDPYVRDIYWYDFKRRDIRNRGYDPKKGVLLHGPYKKVKGEQVLEEGIYYKGTKHGRWTSYDKNDILMDKQKYYKGWPKESLASYYDQERTKLKEIIPVQYGEKEGNYFYFHENGRIAVQGEFRYDAKVGKWTEFYSHRPRRKKVIQFSQDPYDQEFRPYVWREWNAGGQLVYENKDPEGSQ